MPSQLGRNDTAGIEKWIQNLLLNNFAGETEFRADNTDCTMQLAAAAKQRSRHTGNTFSQSIIVLGVTMTTDYRKMTCGRIARLSDDFLLPLVKGQQNLTGGGCFQRESFTDQRHDLDFLGGVDHVQEKDFLAPSNRDIDRLVQPRAKRSTTGRACLNKPIRDRNF